MNVVVFIILMVSGQILFKAASQRVGDSNSIADLIVNSATEWRFVVALAAYAAGTLVWMRILKQMPLSIAYPLAMGSTIALTFLASHYVGLAEFCTRAFRRAKGKSIGPYAQAVATTVLLLKAD